MKNKFLIVGGAGLIGSHIVKKIISEDKGFNDSALNQYYQYNLNTLDCRFQIDKDKADIGIQVRIYV